ncbi:unnamed protein product [Caenorhabditis angaria]|uniref:non-specific protein-tyrosine kinase n=1 Tax=Caenorhabditis angaria TaxID=860376 RepID=A0A9P1J204_9PELO|nr:unnamed protein product [Caenorhabditis angaria]
MTAGTSGVLVDDHVLEILRKAKVEQFSNRFIFQLQVRRFDHFAQVRDKDMISIGLQPAQVKDLRDQIQKMSRELWNRSDPKQVYIASDATSNSQVSTDDRAVIPNSQVKLFEKLGEGSFAVVKRGIWMQNETKKIDVAVKILRDASPTVMEDLKIEAGHLLKLQHPALIRLYGYCQQPAMMVFELCEGGSLLDRLRTDDKPIVLVTQLLDYSVQIAKAFQFLESKHRVHRDLAARNILLSKDEQVVKICDFGLMRSLADNQQMYTMSPEKKVPFAWCAPESLKHRKFSHASDVWSYGVLLWELFTYGEEPWTGSRAIEVMKLIESGERLEKPKYCSTKIYQIMQNCWKHSPDQRCKFNTIREDLKAASFLNCIVREPFSTTQPGYLKLAIRDEVIIIENESNSDYYGQSRKTHNFGIFPSTNVFVQSNTAATSVPITPQKIPAITPVKITPAPPQQKPKMAPTTTTNSKATPTAGSSRISMPVAGSFIHTGHGDPLGNSWGNPSTIDAVYLKNPVKGVPLSRSNGVQIIASKSDINNISSSHPSTSLSLQLDDDFERAFNDSFSPSAIEYPRDIGHTSDISIRGDYGINLTNASTSANVFEKHIPQPALIPTKADTVRLPPPVETIQIIKPKTDINFNQPRHASSSASRLDAMVPTPAPTIIKNQSNGHLPQNLANELKVRIESDAARPRPVSVIGSANVPSFQQPTRPVSVFHAPSNVPLQPTQIPCLVPTPINNTVNMQKTLNQELKVNLTRRATEITTSKPTRSQSTSAQPVIPQPTIPQQQIQPAPKAVISQPEIKQQQIQPTPKPVMAPPNFDAPVAPKSDKVVIRKSSENPALSQDERRSKIISQVSDWLPAPSPLLLGANTTPPTIVAPTKPTHITTLTPAPAVAPTPVPAPVVKKISEPVLSNTVLQPTVLPSARTKSTVDPPTVQQEKRAPVQAPPQVPLFNITNSSTPHVYPSVYPNYSNGYGINNGYAFSNYNSYYNPYGNPSMMRPITMGPTILPSLPSSENQASTSNMITQPLGESDIAELLGRPRSTSVAAVATPKPLSDLSQKMEVLYKEANFTHRGNCDAMVARCNGDVELALKRLKQAQLVEIGVAENVEKARTALEARNYDLAAAANLLLG